MLTLNELLRRRKFLKSKLRAIQLKQKKDRDNGMFDISYNVPNDLYRSIQEIDFLIQYVKMKGTTAGI